MEVSVIWLNVNDGFWILGWRFVSDKKWVDQYHITQFGNRKRAWTRWVHLCIQLRLPLRRRWSWWTGCCRPPAREKPWTITVCLLGPAQWCPTAGDSATWISRPRIPLNLVFGISLVWCPRLHRPRIWSLGPGCRRRRLRRLVWDIIWLSITIRPVLSV